MQCPNCKAPIHPSEPRCLHCGSERPPRRIFTGKQEEFSLKAEDDPFELGETAEVKDWNFPFERTPEPSPILLKTEEATEPAPAPLSKKEQPWAGFWRRACAFLLDSVVVGVLAMVMGLMSFVGYKVGLAGHGRAVTWENVAPLFSMLTLGWLALAAFYFVLFHGMEGKTIGKWILGLRVVGADRSSISYGRALLRWIVTVGLAPIGLGFLWVLWSREKRGWHDYLARTWVIRDS